MKSEVFPYLEILGQNSARIDSQCLGSRVIGNLKFSGQQPLYFAAVISFVTLPLPSRN
jgi:hypothetical protein